MRKETLRACAVTVGAQRMREARVVTKERALARGHTGRAIFAKKMREQYLEEKRRFVEEMGMDPKAFPVQLLWCESQWNKLSAEERKKYCNTRLTTTNCIFWK